MNVAMVLDPDVTTGPGAVGGFFEEDIPDEGRIEARRRVRRVGVAMRRRRSSGRVEDDEFELVAYTQTDDEGRFSFDNLPAGVYRISFEFPGVPIDETSFVEFEISEEDDRTSISLEAVATDDGTIVVTDVTPDPVSVKDHLSSLLKIYPNPASEFVTVDISQLAGNEIVMELVDNSGKKVFSEKLVKNEKGTASVDLNKIEKGVYFIRIRSSDSAETSNIRLVKM